MKVAILGAAGGIGQPLSLLLKAGVGTIDSSINIKIDKLSLYDIVNVHGVAKDLEHINVGPKIESYMGQGELAKALVGCNIVIIPAGIPRKPGMTRDDLFRINAGIVKSLAQAIADNCPSDSLVVVISNPVNSTVPIVVETLKAKGVSNAASRVFGVTTLDVVRASTFVGDALKTNLPEKVMVVGGHSGKTIVPLLSNLSSCGLNSAQIQEVTHRIQFGGDEVVQAKGGAGSATLSMAYAAARFVNAVLIGLHGDTSAANIECAYINLAADSRNGPLIQNSVGGCQYFSVPIRFGRNGFQGIDDYAVDLLKKGSLSELEVGLIENAIPELKNNIQKGIDFAVADLSKL